MQFAEVTGHKSLKHHLIDSVRNNKVSHAQLFRGHEGSAALPLSFAFATYLNCMNKGESDSCGVCPACTKMSKLVHPDVHFSFPVASTTKFRKPEEVISQNFLPDWRKLVLQNSHASIEDWLNSFGAENKQGNISKEESRQIIRNLALKAFEGPYKIMIIWLPEYLHPFAANALLKVLEEPPEKTVFLLVSNDPEKLLPTILSRVQTRTVPAYSDSEIANWLDKQGVEEGLIKEITRIANGSINAAKKLVNHVANEGLVSFREWMRFCFNKDYEGMVNWSDDYQKMGKVAQKSLLNFGLTVLRESLLINSNNTRLSRMSNSEQEFVQKFSKVLDLNAIERLSVMMNRAMYHLERNANPKITMLDLSLSISSVLRS